MHYLALDRKYHPYHMPFLAALSLSPSVLATSSLVHIYLLDYLLQPLDDLSGPNLKLKWLVSTLSVVIDIAIHELGSCIRLP